MKISAKQFFGCIVISACMLVCACAGVVDNGKKSATEVSDSTKKDSKKSTSQLDPSKSALVKINNRLFNVPSPMQLAGLLKDTELPFNKSLLSNTANCQNYTTSLKQALNIGVYGADLGYINVYEQLPEAAAYFGAIRTLSTELGILNSFSDQTMQRIERNNGNKDSLLYIISLIYRESDYYLMNSDRNEISALILAGGWVESVYLMTNAEQKTGSDKKLKQLIGEQKHPLNNLIELLRPYYGKLSNESFDTFLENLSDLAGIFDEVNFKYTFKNVETNPEKKLTVINSESQTNLDNTQLKLIKDKVAKLRTDIIQ